MSLVCLLHVSSLLDEQNWCVMRLLKAASSMATISICLAKPPVIHMSASVWQTMRLGQSQWQNVAWWFLSNCSNVANCKNCPLVSCSHLYECHESYSLIEKTLTGKKLRNGNPAKEKKPVILSGWPIQKRSLVRSIGVYGDGYDCLETLRPRIGSEQISPDEIQHDFLVYDTWMIFEIHWYPVGLAFFWRLRLETLRMWDKPYGSKSLTGIRLWNMCCHPTKATIWIKLNPFDTWKHDSMPPVQMM